MKTWKALKGEKYMSGFNLSHVCFWDLFIKRCKNPDLSVVLLFHSVCKYLASASLPASVCSLLERAVNIHSTSSRFYGSLSLHDFAQIYLFNDWKPGSLDLHLCDCSNANSQFMAWDGFLTFPEVFRIYLLHFAEIPIVFCYLSLFLILSNHHDNEWSKSNNIKD